MRLSCQLVPLDYEMYPPRAHLRNGALRPHYYYCCCDCSLNRIVKNRGGGGGGHSHKQSEGLGGVVWVYQIGLK